MGVEERGRNEWKRKKGKKFEKGGRDESWKS